MSSFFVRSKIFLRLDPVTEWQSLSIVFNRMLGSIFGDFLISDKNVNFTKDLFYECPLDQKLWLAKVADFNEQTIEDK